MRPHVFTVASFMGGVGAGMLGMLRARVQFADETGEHEATFRSLGSVDIDPPACADFLMLTGSRSLCADMHLLTPAELLAFMPECPDVILMSPPCKGFSKLISTLKAAEAYYQKLNELVYRGMFLACETWAPKKPKLILLENVPGITSRGKDVLDRTKAIVHAYGAHVHEGLHDCGEIGGLAQHRKRYLMAVRFPAQVSAFVHKPPIQRVRACGEVLEQLPVPRGPDAEEAGPMHRLPNIRWDTWVKLSRIPAGGDWRDLPAELQPNVDRTKFKGSPGLMGVLDPDEPAQTITGAMGCARGNTPAAIADGRVGHGNRSPLGVRSFAEPMGTVAGRSDPTNGSYSVADPRLARLVTPLKPGQKRREVHPRFGVADWEKAVGTVTGSGSNGVYAVSDPRLEGKAKGNGRQFGNAFMVENWEEPAHTVIGQQDLHTGALSVADPRPKSKRGFNNHIPLRGWNQSALSVIGASQPDSGAQSVAEPRVTTFRNGTYGVISWEQASASILGSAKIDNGPFSVADPRTGKPMPPIIIAEDGTWHRPITTFEMAALQSFPLWIKGKPLLLAGTSSGAWRERIGNAIPPDAGKAMGTSCLMALLCSKLGTWTLDGDSGIWVRDRDHFVMPELEAYAS